MAPRPLFLVIATALAPLAFAQRTQLGGFIGYGGAAQLFENSAYHVVAGVEACVLCGGRFGLALDYQHWQKTGQGTGEPGSLDLVGAALRIQGKGARVRPFFDLGVLAGGETRNLVFRPFNNARTGVAGGMLGFGAAISISEHWYIRPMGRIIGLSSDEGGGFFGAAVGYRF